MNHRIALSIVLLCISITVSDGIQAEDAHGRRGGLVVGQQAPVHGVRFATGSWAAEHTMTCPAARRGNEPKIAIYTDVLDENVLGLAKEVERLIAKDRSLKWSFVAVSDPKGASPTIRSAHYYSKDDLAVRLHDIKTLANQQGLKTLTIGITSKRAADVREQLNLAKDEKVVIAFLDGDRRTSRVVKFVESMHTSELDVARIESLLTQILAIHDR